MIDFSLNRLYQVAGLSKQAVAQARRRYELLESRLELLLVEIDELRALQPGCGVEKMYYTLRPGFLGRDRFINLVMQLGYRLKINCVRPKTTRPGNYYYPNLIEGKTFCHPNEVWQSDITYYEVNERFYYLTFLIDIYTKVVVGYAVSDHMRAEANLYALNMALERFGYPKVHHSDRGSQYLYKPYLNQLKDKQTQVSMGLIGQENAFAERINGTIKNEYLRYRNINSFAELKRWTKQAVTDYNERRIHNHIGRKAPLDFLAEYQGGNIQEQYNVFVPIFTTQ